MAENATITTKKFDVTNREFLLNTEVSAKSLEDIILGINAINRQDDIDEQNKVNFERKPIKLVVDSYGGYCYDGLALANLIETSKTPVHTYCYGKAMSMGLIIYLVGKRRFAHKRATFMQHQASGGTIGKLDDMIQDVKETERLNDMLDEIIIENSDIDKLTLSNYREKKIDWFFTGEDAIMLGIADELI